MKWVCNSVTAETHVCMYVTSSLADGSRQSSYMLQVRPTEVYSISNVYIFLAILRRLYRRRNVLKRVGRSQDYFTNRADQPHEPRELTSKVFRVISILSSLKDSQ